MKQTRNLTPEQKAKSDERKARFRAFVKQVAAMGETEKAMIAAKLGYVTCEGHSLSLCNMMLLALQIPKGSIVGGFRQWLRHGRCVRKGEHGAMIWVPIGRKSEESQAQPSETTTTDSAEKPGFIIGTVFDISQTDEINGQVSESIEPMPVATSQAQAA